MRYTKGQTIERPCDCGEEKTAVVLVVNEHGDAVGFAWPGHKCPPKPPVPGDFRDYTGLGW